LFKFYNNPSYPPLEKGRKSWGTSLKRGGNLKYFCGSPPFEGGARGGYSDLY